MSELDRVIYSMNRKISDGHYGSTDIYFCYGTDKGINETVEDATERCIEHVESIMLNKIEELTTNLEG